MWLGLLHLTLCALFVCFSSNHSLILCILVRFDGIQCVRDCKKGAQSNHVFPQTSNSPCSMFHQINGADAGFNCCYRLFLVFCAAINCCDYRSASTALVSIYARPTRDHICHLFDASFCVF